MFTFEFTQEPGFKNIKWEYAEALWPILLSKRCKFLDKWLEFMRKEDVDIVKRDQWEMLWTLVDQTKGDMANFEDDGCWASIIDEFVEYYSK